MVDRIHRIRIATFSLFAVFAATGCATEQAPEAQAAVEASTAMTSQEAEPPKPSFTSAGLLNRPEGYRAWIYVGTPITPNDLNPPEAAFPEFHNVYIHPGDYAHLERTGEFRDGTILVKELVSVQSTQAVSGNGYFMGDFIGLEATVKDAARFPGEPGNWAYFSFGHVPQAQWASTAERFPTESCAACHLASAADDMVFTQYYPVLRAALRTAASGGG